jgi:methylthioribulose-1-phosphate dehydratase
MFVMQLQTRRYLRVPHLLKPSQCTPLFLAAFHWREAGCCIHSHSQWAVLVTMLVERESGAEASFEIEQLEQVKGIGGGPAREGNLGYFDRLIVPIIENTAR